MNATEEMIIALTDEGDEITIQKDDDYGIAVSVNAIGDSDIYYGNGGTLLDALNDVWLSVPESQPKAAEAGEE